MTDVASGQAAPQCPFHDESRAPNGCPVSARAAEFDPFGDGYQQDPPDYVRWAREQEPVFFSPKLGYWVVTRYDDIKIHANGLGYPASGQHTRCDHRIVSLRLQEVATAIVFMRSPWRPLPADGAICELHAARGMPRWQPANLLSSNELDAGWWAGNRCHFAAGKPLAGGRGVRASVGTPYYTLDGVAAGNDRALSFIHAGALLRFSPITFPRNEPSPPPPRHPPPGRRRTLRSCTT